MAESTPTQNTDELLRTIAGWFDDEHAATETVNCVTYCLDCSYEWPCPPRRVMDAASGVRDV